MADGIITPCNVTRLWHWFRQVTAPCNVACGSGIVTMNSPSAAPCNVIRCSGMTCHWIRPNVRHYWNSTSGFDFDHITALNMSFRTSLQNFIQIGPPSAEKMTSCQCSRWRISAILDFRDPIMGSLKSQCTTSYRSSIEIITINWLIFFRKSHFCILATYRRTDRQTNRQMDTPVAWSEAALAVASGSLTSVSETIRKLALVKAQTALKNKICRKGFSIWRTLQCGTIMTLISPGDCTLQCGMWLWSHEREFTKW